MAEAGIRLTKRKVSQTLDLSDIVGKDISGNSRLVKKITQGILDYITERSSQGLGLGRKDLHSPYSDSYAKSAPFIAAGKSKRRINMRLSGDMVRSMDILEEDGSVVTFGIEDSEEAIKAYAHQTGFEGHPTISGPKREWFGVTPAEVKKYVLPDFKQDIAGTRKLADNNGEASAVDRVNNIRTIADLLVQEDEN